MSVSRPTATEAEELLSLLRQSISEANLRTRSAVHFVGESSAVKFAQRLQLVQAAATSFGSLPPCPPTIRGWLGLSLLRLTNRLLWWHTAVSKQFAIAMRDFAQVQVEEHTNQQQLMTDMEERLRAVEEMLQQLGAKRTQEDVGERP